MTELQRYAQKALGLIDLTSLNTNDTEQDIIDLCNKANTDFGSVAAVCVYPKFVKVARSSLNANGLNHVKVATVTNFPEGKDSLDAIIELTERAIADGADEIDVVLPYEAFIKGDLEHCEQVITESKLLCSGPTLLKVIIESGKLKDPSVIKAASEFCVDCGADFIKTSTGKVEVNATLEAAEIMLKVIKQNNKEIGFKAAGGIRTAEEAMTYIKLAEDINGLDWIHTQHFRFGASGLLSDLTATLSGTRDSNNTTDTY